MPANSQHAEYDAALPVWLRARDVLAGEDAVKAGGERYLPKLELQSAAEYAAYKQRATFYNATARTAAGALGLIFRREPTFKCGSRMSERGKEGSDGAKMSGVEKALAAFVEDADLLGTPLSGYAKNVTGEVIGVGRAGTLIDWEGGSATGTRGEQRAYAVAYRAEQIINWRTARVMGRCVPTLVVLREKVESRKQKAESGEVDEFEAEEVEQIRVLKLEADAEGNPFCRVDVWREQMESGAQGTARPTKNEWVLVESRIPLRLGRPLPLIPFVFHGPRHSLPAVDKLPLADVIAVNLAHYRLDADYKHGLHFTALPTAWVSGFDKDDNLQIGSSTAWVAAAPGAQAGFLEFTGQGLTSFERALDRLERHMAVLGTRMLEEQKRAAETVAAIAMRQSGETSVLTTIAQSVSDSLTHVLRWVYWWNSTEESPEAIGPDVVLVSLNTDFSVQGMSSDELTAVVKAWQGRAISQDTMLDLFRAGEVIPAGRSNEEEQGLIEQQSREDAKEDGVTVPTDVGGKRVK